MSAESRKNKFSLKNIKLTPFCIAAAFVFVALNSCRILDRADRARENYEYSKAIPRYKKALEKDGSNDLAWAHLGDCYKMNNQTIEAEQCFEKALAHSKVDNIYKLYYAQVLFNNMKYLESKQWIESYKASTPSDSRAVALDSSLNEIENLKRDENKYKVDKLMINSPEADFSPAFYKDGIVFTSSRKSIEWADRNDKWTGQNYYSLYFSKGKGAEFQSPIIFQKNLQSKFNNSSLCFNSDGTEMIITRNNVENGKVRKSEDREVKLKLYTSIFKDGKWSDVIPFQYNSDEYSCAHPALSLDGKKLYFSSDMPGTIGAMDLWVCNRTDIGWSKPVNMGPQINTLGNELFPTVDGSDAITFSTNGRGGLGGLDIFSTKEIEGGYSPSINKGAPFNSSDDDFGLVWNVQDEAGYLSSNRTHQNMNDEIFSISKNNIMIALEGNIQNEITAMPVNDAMVTLVNLTQNDSIKIMTDSAGYYSFTNLPAECNYCVIMRNNYCIGNSVDTSTIGIKTNTTIRIDMNIACLDLNVTMKNIYYDLDKYAIRPDAAVVLDKLVAVLKAFPNVRIELSSHTDSRASFSYNMKLSDNRAKSAVQYLVSRGIESDRLIARGYGETQLVNRCAGEGKHHIECTEEEHQMNRRTEIRILSWDKVAKRE